MRRSRSSNGVAMSNDLDQLCINTRVKDGYNEDHEFYRYRMPI
jgi:hypothetical protein